VLSDGGDPGPCSPRWPSGWSASASLLSAIVHGVIIERYLLRLGRVANASPDQIIALLRPCFETLATAQTTASTDQPATDG
jgi:hypothetical protein